MLASVFEAVVAAVYLDCGLDAVRDWVLVRGRAGARRARRRRWPSRRPRAGSRSTPTEPRADLPAYRVVSVEGPDHDRHYVVEVEHRREMLGRGEGRNRREAETEAASAALVGPATEAAGRQPRRRRATAAAIRAADGRDRRSERGVA